MSAGLVGLAQSGAMNTLLVSHATAAELERELTPLLRDGTLRLLTLPADDEPPLSPEQLATVTGAYFSRDLHQRPSAGGAQSARTFFKALDQAPDLRWLQIFFAGVSSLNVTQKLQARGVQISTATGVAAEPIAQSVLAAVLGFSRGLLHHIDAQRRAAWEHPLESRVPRPLAGQRATVVGMGAIGREVVRLFGLFGLRVRAVRQSAEPVEGCEAAVPYARLHELLPDTDWLVIACPLTDTTRQLIDARALALLPARAHLVNIARGDVVDEVALIEALSSQRLAGAYLDVFAKEPLPADSPLWSLKNVLVSPHDSGARTDYEAQVHAVFVDNLRRFVDGRPLTRLAIQGG